MSSTRRQTDAQSDNKTGRHMELTPQQHWLSSAALQTQLSTSADLQGVCTSLEIPVLLSPGGQDGMCDKSHLQ